MATSLQQLLDDLTAAARATPRATPMEEVAGVFGHLGRALARLAEDGLTADVGPRDRAAAELGRACAAVGALWPATGGPASDVAGAAADLIGRDRALLGRAHRWAIVVELAEVADGYARLARLLWPHAAVVELTALRRLAAAIERDAQTDPPTGAGSTILDRLVPLPGIPRETTDKTASDAAASLAAALDRADRTGELTLRAFRATIAAAEITSRYAAAVTAATTDDRPGPQLAAAAAWQLAGRTSMSFDDGRGTTPTDPRGVVAWAQALAGVLRAEIGPTVDIAALRDRPDLDQVLLWTRPVVNQLPLLGERLDAVVGHWSRTGRLSAAARDLPPMADMPEDRIRDVLAGRRVEARGHDLDLLGQAVQRAGALSTALADTLNHAAGSEAPTLLHLANHYAHQVRAAGAAERLLSHAQAVREALDAAQTPMRHPTRGHGLEHRPDL